MESQIKIVLRPVILLAMFLAFGCAQQMKSVKAEPVSEMSSTALIQSITVADDGTRIEIISDRPIVYTYYMLDNPPRVIVDLAQTAPGQQTFPIDINKGALRRLDVAKHEFGSGVLSRIDVSLNEKSEISAALDQQDKKKLVLTIPIPVTVKQEPVKVEAKDVAASSQEPVITANQEPKAANITNVVPVIEPAVVADTQVPLNHDAVGTGHEAVKVENKESVLSRQETTKTEAVKELPPNTKVETVEVAKPGSLLLSGTTKKTMRGDRSLSAIKRIEDGLLLELTAEPDSFKVFKLAQPERLVIDIHKTSNALVLNIVDINAFNLGKARIGEGSDKLRVVFDSLGAIPHYSVVKSGSALLVTFGNKNRGLVSNDPEPEKKVLNYGGKPESSKKEADVPVIATPAVEVAIVPVEPDVVKKPIPVSSVTAVPLPQNTATTEPVISGQAPEKADTEPRLSATSTTVKAAVKKPGVVEAVEFTQIDGVSRITIKTSGGCIVREPVKTAKGLSLALKGCRLPVKLQRELDTKGFDSTIRTIVPFSVKSGVAPESRIAVNLKGSVPNALHRDGDVIQWDFKEPVKTVKASKPVKVSKALATVPMISSSVTLDKDMTDAKNEQVPSRVDKSMEDAFQLEKASQPVSRQGKVYAGRKVTLEFSDADIRKIFQLLAEVSNQNFLISDDVTGTISLKLVNVPWDQALDVILENKGLGMLREGNIVQIRPKTKMKSLDDEAVEMRLTEEKKMPLSTVIFDINFATLSEIETQFKNLKSKRPDSSISNDMRTNKIIVVDIDPNINKMRKLLEQLDVPEKQVMIEARIVEASSNFARDIGVKWNFGYQDGSASVANINNLTGSMGGVVTNVLPTGTTGGVAAGMAFGKLLSNIQLDMRLSAASTVGQVKIISTPKVMTVNNKAAKISQGQMIPYQNTSSTDGAKTEFIEAALSLEVTPHITADGSVNMKIKASNNTAGVGSPPPINKKEATTELVVKNGETTVIGGIYVDSETEGDTGVPYLSDIPLLGWMFKSNSKSKTKNEMLIFITPRILN